MMNSSPFRQESDTFSRVMAWVSAALASSGAVRGLTSAAGRNATWRRAAFAYGCVALPAMPRFSTCWKVAPFPRRPARGLREMAAGWPAAAFCIASTMTAGYRQPVKGR